MMYQPGRTTAQIVGAPKGAIFVCCGNNILYAHKLPAAKERPDLKFVPQSWLTLNNVLGIDGLAIVVDHAAYLTDEQTKVLEYIHLRQIMHANSSKGAS